MTNAIYARQSVDKADSISIESQIEFCKYELRGEPFEIYQDKGYSGKTIHRPEFQRMLQGVRAGNIKRVICYKLDRCSRSILDFSNLMDEFQQNGVEFISCTEKFDTSTPMGRAMLNICIVFAQLERETIQQRVFDAYHSRNLKGFYMGGRVPLGFQLSEHAIEGKRTSKYTIIPSEAKILQLMYKEYAKPHTSFADVVQMLRSKGIPHPRKADGIWVRSHIGRMLRNPIYVRADETIYDYFIRKGATIHNPIEDFAGIYGCYLYNADNRKCIVLAPHEGIVSSDLWLRCILKSKQGKLYPSVN